MPSIEDEKRVILHWLAHREQEGKCAQPVQWVDSERGGDIDALAPPFAIEHTSVDALADQRRYAAQFRTLLNGLSDLPVTTWRLRIILDRTGFGTVSHRQLLACLRQWIPRHTPDLPEGHSSGNELCGLEIPWHCFKHSDRPPGLNIGLAVDTDALSGAHIVGLLRRKAAKLQTYKLQGYTTILIVESSDLALLAAPVFLELLLPAIRADDLKGVDEVWFADTSLDDVELWEVVLGEEELYGPFYPRLEQAV